MLFLHNLTQGLVDVCRGISLVASAIDADGGMAADAVHVVLGIVNEHVGIIGIGAVGGIGQPEVLPYHDAVFITRFIQLFVANHAHPVAHHGEVHVLVIGDGCLVFTSAVVEVYFAESPVATHADEATPVDIEVQYMIVFIEVHLADTYLEVFFIRDFSVYLEGEVGIVQVRFSIAVGPPQARVLHLKLREILGVEPHGLLFLGRQLYGLLEGDVAHLSGQDAFHIPVGVVLHDDFRSQGSLCSVRQCQSGLYEGVLNGDLSGAGQSYIIPYAYVASAHRRNPVPADGGMEGRIVRSQDTSVEVRALFVLLLDGTDMLVLDDFHRQYIRALLQEIRHVKLATDEGTLQASGFLSVQVDIGLPVDAVKVQRHTITLEALRHFEFIAIPEVGVEVGFGRYQLIVRIVQVGQGACLDVAAQYRAGYCGYHPLRGLIIRRRNDLAAFLYFGCPLHLPVSAREGQISIGNAGHRCRLGYQTSAAHHLYFAQHIRLSVG